MVWHFLVFCRWGWGVRILLCFHSGCVLAYIKVGRSRRWASLWPMVSVDILHDGLEHWCPFAEPSLSASYRVGVLLSSFPRRRRQGFIGGSDDIFCTGGSRSLRCCTGNCNSRRLDGAVICERTRHAFQYGTYYLHRLFGGSCALGHLWELHRSK